MTIQEKTCSKCKEEKSISLFQKDKSTKDGLNRHCAECKSKSNKTRRLKNIEQIRERERASYIKYRDKKQQKQKIRYRKNILRDKTKSSDYRKANKEKIIEYRRQLRKYQPEKLQAYQKKHRDKLSDSYIRCLLKINGYPYFVVDSRPSGRLCFIV